MTHGGGEGGEQEGRVRAYGAWPQALLAALVVATSPTRVDAQLSVVGGGGAILPVGDFGSVATLGYSGSVGIQLPLGARGLSVALEGTAGRVRHARDVAHSRIYGGGLTARQTLQEERGARVGFSGTLQWLRHQGVSRSFPELAASRSGLAAGAGVELGAPVGRGVALVAVSYTRGLFGLDSDAFPTEYVSVQVGARIALGSGRAR